MPIESDPTLWKDPLWRALEGAIDAITDHPDTVWRTPHRPNGLNANEINSRAEEAGLSNCLVMKVEEACNQTGQVQMRWLTVNHPGAPDPIRILVMDRRGTPAIPQPRIYRIIDYLRAWQSARAKQLKPIEQPGDGSAARRPRRSKADIARDEGNIAAHLAEHPDATRDELAKETGIAPAHVSASVAWKAHKARQKEARKANRARASGGVGDPSVDRYGGDEDDY